MCRTNAANGTRNPECDVGAGRAVPRTRNRRRASGWTCKPRAADWPQNAIPGLPKSNHNANRPIAWKNSCTKLELAARDLAHQRTTLEERLREDYKIEIGELTKQANAAEQAAREEIDREIADLRRKLNNIGSINMEALHELDQLESRFQSLNSQYQDLVQAKEALERIIQKINADSRRLFAETLEAVRANFQTLFRERSAAAMPTSCSKKESISRHRRRDHGPTAGQEPQFNNSLLSGGEKTLTCVALLLAIFQSAPARSACSTKSTRPSTKPISTASSKSSRAFSAGPSSSSSRIRRRR